MHGDDNDDDKLKDTNMDENTVINQEDDDDTENKNVNLTTLVRNNYFMMR